MIRSGEAPWRMRLAVCSLLVAALPAIVSAHTAQAAEGFMTGLLHPVFGPDHFLAMLSVGIVSAQMGGIRIWTVPAMFVTAMIAGAMAGASGQAWPLSEEGIALTVVLLGMAIATVTPAVRSWPVMLAVALFGSLHGHAHGVELPRSVDPVYYGGGFVVSTAAIHLLGVGIGHALTSHDRRVPFLRPIGTVMACMGLTILLTRITTG